VETVRDLGRSEPWQESLERSRARRTKGTRSSPAVATPRRRPRSGPTLERRDRLPRTGRPAKRVRFMVVSAGAVVLALLAVVLPSTPGGRRAQASPSEAQVDAFRAPAGQAYASSVAVALRTRARAAARAVNGAAGCQPAVKSSGYVNPLAGAVVTGERIDQGVDYAGSGMLVSLGAAKVTYVATSDTGWPGAFIEYRLSDGPDRGCYVYYAEGVNPMPGLHVGARVRAGQPIANIIPGWASGVELGWGAGRSTGTYAAKLRQWSARKDADSVASAAGRSFSSMVAALGGPPGKVEG
jgi:hypothetical protein